MARSFESFDREFTAFVQKLNREDISVDELKSAVEKKTENMSRDVFRFFIDVLFDELFVWPESLRNRRLSGELDEFLQPYAVKGLELDEAAQL